MLNDLFTLPQNIYIILVSVVFLIVVITIAYRTKGTLLSLIVWFGLGRRKLSNESFFYPWDFLTERRIKNIESSMGSLDASSLRLCFNLYSRIKSRLKRFADLGDKEKMSEFTENLLFDQLKKYSNLVQKLEDLLISKYPNELWPIEHFLLVSRSEFIDLLDKISNSYWVSIRQGNLIVKDKDSLYGYTFEGDKAYFGVLLEWIQGLRYIDPTKDNRENFLMLFIEYFNRTKSIGLGDESLKPNKIKTKRRKFFEGMPDELKAIKPINQPKEKTKIISSIKNAFIKISTRLKKI